MAMWPEGPGERQTNNGGSPADSGVPPPGGMPGAFAPSCLASFWAGRCSPCAGAFWVGVGETVWGPGGGVPKVISTLSCLLV